MIAQACASIHSSIPPSVFVADQDDWEAADLVDLDQAEGQSDVEVGIRALFERELDVAADGERAGPPDIPGMPFISDIPEIPVMSPVVAGASFVPAAR